jgi:putative DNA primase/helicase
LLTREQFIEQSRAVDPRKEVLRALGVLVSGRRFEIRALNPFRSGVFDDLEAAARAVVGRNGKHKGIYWMLNPVNAPVTNRLEKDNPACNADQVERREWLLIDIEGARPNAKAANATADEVLAAIHLAERIRETTVARPLVLCSGNGCHLLYKIDLANNKETTDLVARALKGLATLYNNAEATVDDRVSDPARISKLPGTMTRKGEHTEDRPQRYSFVLDWGVEGRLSKAKLEAWAQHALAETAPAKPAEKTTRKSNRDPVERARAWLAKRDPAVEGQHGDEQLWKTCAELVAGFALDEHDAFTLLSEWNQSNVPPFSEKELLEKIRNARKNAKQEVGGKLTELPEWEEATEADERLNSYAWTDLGNARALLYLYGDRIRWCTTSQRWFTWRQTHWEDDSKNTVLAWANKTALRRLAASELLEDEDTRKQAQRYFRSCQGTAKRNAALEQVKAWVPNVCVTAELDRDPWLLNCKNGTYNLRTGQLQQHRQDDLITRCVLAEYDPTAQAPRWHAFLDRVFAGNAELIGYLQRAVGYSLTGSTREHAVFISYGGGHNGKSLFLNVLGELLGEYAWATQRTTFTEAKSETIRNDLAQLNGRRMVRCSETNSNFRFDEGLLKQMSGEDTMTARFLRAEFFQFKPTFKIWLATNYKPTVAGTDTGIWRRIKLIPWQVEIPEAERDEQLGDKLAAERPGILAWALEGCRQWLGHGLQEPAIIKEAVAEYRRSSDLFGQFVDECCQVDIQWREQSKTLYHYFREWLKQTGEWEYSQRRMALWMESKGFQQIKSNGARYWSGIRVNLNLRKEEDPPEELDQAVQDVIEGFEL